MATEVTKSKRSGPLRGPARGAWSSLFIAHRQVEREVERRLHEAGLPPLVWYDVLYSLHLAEEDALKQCDLAERVMLSPSGLSRLLDRMVERGVVERHEAPGDRRATALAVTAAGIELMREIWEHYGGVLEQHFAPAVKGSEAELERMLGAVSASLGGPEDPGSI